MTESGPHSLQLSKTVIRICAACGVVNPSGPSENCAHFQLAKFDGIDNRLLDLLEKVAVVRRDFAEIVGKLKHLVKEAIAAGEAEVETTLSTRPSDTLNLKSGTATLPNLKLDNLQAPEKRSASKPRAKKQRRTGLPAKVDPRQLELIVHSPPKGNA